MNPALTTAQSHSLESHGVQGQRAKQQSGKQEARINEMAESGWWQSAPQLVVRPRGGDDDLSGGPSAAGAEESTRNGVHLSVAFLSKGTHFPPTRKHGVAQLAPRQRWMTKR